MSGKLVVRTLLLAAVMAVSAGAYAETVWIDVRSAAEHAADRIEGDIHIPHDEIVPGVRQRFPDKGTELRLYCASGVRAGKATAALEDAGYTNVENVGGIDDARRERGIRE